MTDVGSRMQLTGIRLNKEWNRIVEQLVVVLHDSVMIEINRDDKQEHKTIVRILLKVKLEIICTTISFSSANFHYKLDHFFIKSDELII